MNYCTFISFFCVFVPSLKFQTWNSAFPFEQNLALALYEASKKTPNGHIPAKHRQDLGVSTMVTPAVTVAVVVTAAVEVAVVAAADAVAAAVDVVVPWIACSSIVAFLHVQTAPERWPVVNRIIDNRCKYGRMNFHGNLTGGEITSLYLYLGYM